MLKRRHRPEVSQPNYQGSIFIPATYIPCVSQYVLASARLVRYSVRSRTSFLLPPVFRSTIASLRNLRFSYIIWCSPLTLHSAFFQKNRRWDSTARYDKLALAKNDLFRYVHLRNNLLATEMAGCALGPLIVAFSRANDLFYQSVLLW